jgi:hypothetical protein
MKGSSSTSRTVASAGRAPGAGCAAVVVVVVAGAANGGAGAAGAEVGRKASSYATKLSGSIGLLM